MTFPLRIGTRGSQLALWQAHYVADHLRTVAPDVPVELVEIQTSGDLILDVPLVELGGQGAFTKEIQKALQAKLVDVAVHSLKDLPTFAVENLILAAVPPRGPVGDAFVSHKYASFTDLPLGAMVATSSLRRQAQIRHRRPDLQLVNIRGNVETRLRKLDEKNLDAIILAEAGLVRLGLQNQISEILPSTWMLPAVGQGALGLECRADDGRACKILDLLNDPQTKNCVLAERALLRGLGGGCQVPIGSITVIAGTDLHLRGVVLPPDGSTRLENQIQGSLTQAESLGSQLAEILLAQGADQLLGG